MEVSRSCNLNDGLPSQSSSVQHIVADLDSLTRMGSIASRFHPRQSTSGVPSAASSSQGAKHHKHPPAEVAFVSLDSKKEFKDKRCPGADLVSKRTSATSSRQVSVEELAPRPDLASPAIEKRQPLSSIPTTQTSNRTKSRQSRHEGTLPKPALGWNREPTMSSDGNITSNQRSHGVSHKNSSSPNKENMHNFAIQARSLGDDQRQRQQRNAIQTVRTSQINRAASCQRLQKKLRPTSQHSDKAKTSFDAEREKSTNIPMSVGRPEQGHFPIDPPGSVLGALPWIPPYEGFSTNMYTGFEHSNCHRSYSAMANWDFHSASHAANIHGWTLPPFLAPIANTVRHPFANFIAHQSVQYNELLARNGNSNYTPMEAENSEVPACSVDTDTSMRDAIHSRSKSHRDTKMDETTDILPSTFAPIECIEQIRRRRSAETNDTQKATSQRTISKPSQARILTRSASKAMKTGDKALVPHQAASPTPGRVKPSPDSSNSVRFKGCDKEDSVVPEIMIILGKKVTMIDPVRKVFIIDMLSPEQCDAIRMMADNHTLQAHLSGSSEPVWRTLYTYTKMDLPVCEVTGLREKYTDRILLDVKRIVGEIFGKKKEAMALRPRSWKEPHILLYQALDGKPHHTGIEMHYDGCDITWQAMLTRNDEYEGGGTYMRCLRKTVILRQGQVLVHPGELYHKGLDITSGVRCLLVCFTDGMSPKILDDSKPDEDDPKYEKNVCIY